MFFKDDIFFSKKLGKKSTFFMVDKTKQNFCLKIMNTSLRRKKKSIFLLKTLPWAPKPNTHWRHYRVVSGFQRDNDA